MEVQGYQDAQNEISLKDILRILRKRRFWLITTFIVVVGLVAGYLYQATPIYQASATLWVEPSQSSNSLEDIFSLQTGANTTRISTEVELIKSRRNIDKIIQDLNLIDYYTRLSDGKSEITTEKLRNTIATMVSVSTVKDTNIVRISVENANPVLARNIANTLAVVYNDMLKELAQNAFTVRRSFIESQIGITEKNVILAEDRLRSFKEAQNIFLLTEEAQLLLENITNYEKQIDPYRIQLGEADSKIDTYRSLLMDNGHSPVAYETVILDHKLKSYKIDLSRIKLELQGYQQSGEVMTQQSTSRKDELRARVIRLESDIRQRIKEVLFSEVTGIDAYVRSAFTELSDAYTLKYLASIDIEYLSQIKRTYDTKMAALPALEQQLLDLQRDVTVKENLYILLLENFEEAKIAEAAVTGTSTIIDEAVTPLDPIKPNKKMMLAIGVLLGLFLGVLIVFLIEAFDDAIKDEESIRRSMGMEIPILGRIPHLTFDESGKYPELIVYNEPTAPPSEAYKLIATNVLYSSVEAPQVVCVTSAEMAQGKTSVLANTGIAMAQNGLRTIMIDADMRKPRLEKAFGMQRSPNGLVNHLLQQMPLDQVIRTPLEELPNLHLLAVGPLPPNPTAILTSEKFRQVITKLRKKYDRILIDLPPLLAASDALIASRSSDGIIMVVRSAQSSKYGLKLASENISNSGIPVVGIVINDITREDSYHYYHYYYYYQGSDGAKAKKRKSRTQYKKSTRAYTKGRRTKGVVKRSVPTLDISQKEQIENLLMSAAPDAAEEDPSQTQDLRTSVIITADQHDLPGAGVTESVAEPSVSRETDDTSEPDNGELSAGSPEHVEPAVVSEGLREHIFMDDEAGRVAAGTEKEELSSSTSRESTKASPSAPRQKDQSNKRTAKKNKRRNQLKQEKAQVVGASESVSERTAPNTAKPLAEKPAPSNKHATKRSGTRSPFDYITELEMEVTSSVQQPQEQETHDDDTKGEA